MLLLVFSGCNRQSNIPADIAATLPEVVDYNFHIKPILSDRCYTCHGPDENTREADLRLDTESGPYEAIGDDRDRYAVVPGKPHKSELIKRIYSEDPEVLMPTPESNLSLTDYEKALLQRWIEQGAEWKPHWAFIPAETPALPETEAGEWPNNEIDRFILARLEVEGLDPSGEAAREALLRRVTFDLIGLPPTIQEIDAFQSDASPDAYGKVVDRLLASPAYGERMAVDWLDVARYADTGGYQSDRLRRMWPWRDWVVDAFNNNLPFDDFMTWQLAGDLLPDATVEQQMATAFNRNHRQTEEGGSIEEEFRAEYAADRTNTTATAFLGLTMECSRCHDHKYDPISQKEYYQFYSFFNNIDESGQTSFFTDAVPVPTLLLADDEMNLELAAIRKQIIEQEKEIERIRSNAREAFKTWAAVQSPAALLFKPEVGLTGHFPLDQIQGTATPNRVRNGKPGKTVYDPSTAPGKLNRAVVFDGENGIEFEGTGNFERTDPFSVSLWIKAAEWNASNVIVHHTKAALDAGSRGYELSMEEDKLIAGLTHMWPENAIRIKSKKGLPLNEWVHLAMTYDGSSKASGLTIYADGEPLETEIVRDNLFKNITYERVDVNLTLGYRFRDKGFKDGLVDELRVYDRALTAIEVAQLSGTNPLPGLLDQTRSVQDDDRLFAHYLNRHHQAYRRQQVTLHSLRKKENNLIKPVPEIMVMKEMNPRRPTYVLNRGLYNNKGEEVNPGTPSRIMAFPDDLPANRLGLAQWLSDPANPLTARVIVNRYWQQFFGQGLVTTPDDFGNQGALPSHPALLDWLATTFVDSGWDVKALQKMIVMSATYRQDSYASPELQERDPSNVLLAHGPRMRLTSEMIRDNALAASGLLVRKMGGPAVKPYQPAGLWKEKSGQAYVRDTGEGLYRRSLYTFWKRTSPPPSMIILDAAQRNQCEVRRQRTTTPMQALLLLNDPQFIEASRVLAERLFSEAGDSQQARIKLAMRLLTSRLPTDSEIEVIEQIYQEQLEEFSNNPANTSALLAIGDAPYDTSLDKTKLAATTMMVSTIMNFDASVIKR